LLQVCYFYGPSSLSGVIVVLKKVSGVVYKIILPDEPMADLTGGWFIAVGPEYYMIFNRRDL